MTQITFTIDEEDLKKLIINSLESKLGEISLDKEKVRIEVKSKQNYKSEWEIAAFRATYNACI